MPNPYLLINDVYLKYCTGSEFLFKCLYNFVMKKLTLVNYSNDSITLYTKYILCCYCPGMGKLPCQNHFTPIAS